VREAQLKQQVGVIEQETERQKMVLEAQGLAQKRAIEGYTYQEERGFDVAEKVGANEGVGQMTNLGIGMGLMVGVGGTVGNAVGGLLQNTMGNLNNQLPPTAPPHPPASTADGFESRLAKLELLKGKIPNEMYNAKMQEILDSI